jgi:cell wall-associated NlpC family hydrolase
MNSDWQNYIKNAIEWAQAQLGSEAYAFRCLAFVEDAYEIANRVEIFGGSSAKESADEYGTWREPSTPPPGTFVFYDNSGTLFDTYKNWGHVGLSLGNGRVIHAWDKVRIDGYLDVEQLQGVEGWTHPQYIGWTPVERIFEGHYKKSQDEK